MGKFTKEALEKRRTRRKRKAAKHMPTGDEAVKNALDKGLVTIEQVSEYWQEESKRERARQEAKQAAKKKPKARIFYGLNTNSM
jgi:hypothetical protein